MKWWQLLPSAGRHEILQDSGRRIALRGRPPALSSERAILLSLLLIGLIVGPLVFLPVGGHLLILIGICSVLILLSNISGHLGLIRNRPRRYRLLTVSEQGIRLQRSRNSREIVIPKSEIHGLQIKQYGSQLLIYLNGGTQPMAEVNLKKGMDEVFVQRMTALLDLGNGQTTTSRYRTVRRFQRSLTFDGAPPRTLKGNKRSEFYRVKEADDRFTVTLTNNATGSNYPYRRFIYTYDGHLHQLDTGTKIKLPIPIDTVRTFEIKTYDLPGEGKDGDVHSVYGEFSVVTEKQKVETLLRTTYRFKRDRPFAAADLRERLGELRARLLRLQS